MQHMPTPPSLLALHIPVRRDEDELTCPICLDIPEAVVVQCIRGHIFCERCLKNVPQRRCPTCRVALPDEPIRSLDAERDIAALPAQCTSCHVYMTRSELCKHAPRCPQRRMPCSAAVVGCEWSGPISELAVHERTCTHAACVQLLAQLREHLEQATRLKQQERERKGWGRRVLGKICTGSNTAAAAARQHAERRAVVDAGMLMTVVQSMQAHADEARLQEQGCASLAIVCGGCATAATREQAVAHLGALSVVVRGMRAHMDAAGVQQHGCHALHNICCGTDTAAIARKQAAADAGALEAVTGGMWAHVVVPGVQQQGCAALAEICFGTDAGGRKRSQAAADAGALVAVASAMQTHVGSVEVQEKGCRAIANICYGGDGVGIARKTAASDAGALAAIVIGMRAHPGEARVHEVGRTALRNICRGSEALREAALQAGAQTAWLPATLCA